MTVEALRRRMYEEMRKTATGPDDPVLSPTDRATWLMALYDNEAEVRRIAVHEAGHAIAASVGDQAVPVAHVRIRWTWGHAHAPRLSGGACTIDGARTAGLLVAGSIAEKLAGYGPGTPVTGSADDRLLRFRDVSYVEEVSRDTEITLRAYWSAVLRVARALEKTQWLDGAVVRQLVRG